MPLPAFTAGRKVRASELAALVAEANRVAAILAIESKRAFDATSRTTTSTSYTTTLSPANILGVSFVAPPSGKVLILWSTNMSNSSSPNIAQTSPAVRAGSTVGSGTSFLAAGTYHLTGIANQRTGSATEVTGLTPGDTYNVALEHRAFSAGTATFEAREVTVVPLAN